MKYSGNLTVLSTPRFPRKCDVQSLANQTKRLAVTKGNSEFLILHKRHTLINKVKEILHLLKQVGLIQTGERLHTVLAIMVNGEWKIDGALHQHEIVHIEEKIFGCTSNLCRDKAYMVAFDEVCPVEFSPYS